MGGKFPIAEAVYYKRLICYKCKSRNPPGSKLCRKCGYTYLRKKKKKRAAKA